MTFFPTFSLDVPWGPGADEASQCNRDHHQLFFYQHSITANPHLNEAAGAVALRRISRSLYNIDIMTYFPPNSLTSL